MPQPGDNRSAGRSATARHQQPVGFLRRAPRARTRGGGARAWVPSVLLAMALTAAGSPPVAAQGLVQLDRAVAAVGDQVITASDVEIARSLARQDPGGLPVLAPPDAPDASDDDVERWWIQQVVIRQLAGDVDVYQPSAGELRDRVRAMLDSLGEGPAWTDLQSREGLDRARLEAWLRNRLVVERFVLRNIGALGRRGEIDEVDPARYAAWLDQIRGSIDIRRIRPMVEAP